MNRHEQIEMAHWKPEAYRSQREAGIDQHPCADHWLASFERVLAAVGWVGFTALVLIVLYR